MRFKEIKKVLLKILVLNWLVAFAKIFIGFSTGTISIMTDGFHSLFDGLTNIVGFLGIKLAEKPADENHPYGYRKYEAIASLMILFFFAITVYEISKSIFRKMFHPSTVDADWFLICILAGCIFIDYLVARYEYKKGKELKSTILQADASHTKSHYITTGAVILGVLLMKLGCPPVIDPIIAIFVAVFIFKLGYGIFKDTTAVLSDMALVDAEKIRKIAESVGKIESCHKIRTRGDESHIFMDLHIALESSTSLADAHAICQNLKAIIQNETPEIKDIIIHLETEENCNQRGQKQEERNEAP